MAAARISWSSCRPAGPVFQAGTLVGAPAGDGGRPVVAERPVEAPLQATGAPGRRAGARPRRGRARGRRAAAGERPRVGADAVLHRASRCATTGRRSRRTPCSTPRSSAACSRAASICRRRRSRRGSSRPRTPKSHIAKTLRAARAAMREAAAVA